jgi:ubiquinol-cytochrome c reductase iron-sulfur subunit
VAGGAFAVASACPFVASLAPSARARAAGAPVKADIAPVGPGQLKTVVWRGQPVWLFRRTPQMLESLKGHDGQLVDPFSQVDQQPPYCRNQTRSIKPEMFVAVGLCTHLGCTPHLQDVDGQPQPTEFFCPCHGSIYDLAGRVYKDVPAPRNLLIPRHRYLSASRILIGDDKGGD